MILHIDCEFFTYITYMLRFILPKNNFFVIFNRFPGTKFQKFLNFSGSLAPGREHCLRNNISLLALAKFQLCICVQGVSWRIPKQVKNAPPPKNPGHATVQLIKNQKILFSAGRQWTAAPRPPPEGLAKGQLWYHTNPPLEKCSSLWYYPPTP